MAEFISNKQKPGSTKIRTQITGLKVQRANHYTMEPQQLAGRDTKPYTACMWTHNLRYFRHKLYTICLLGHKLIADKLHSEVTLATVKKIVCLAC